MSEYQEKLGQEFDEKYTEFFNNVDELSKKSLLRVLKAMVAYPLRDIANDIDDPRLVQSETVRINDNLENEVEAFNSVKAIDEIKRNMMDNFLLEEQEKARIQVSKEDRENGEA